MGKTSSDKITPVDVDASRYVKVKRFKSHRVKGRLSTRITSAIIYIILGIMAISMLSPFLYIVAGSFATEKELTERAFFIIPRVVSLNAYNYIWEQGTIFRGLRNSFFLTAVGTLWCMSMTTIFAYPLSKRQLVGKNIFLNMVIVTMLFGGGMIPTFLLIKSLKMLDSYWALTIPGAIGAFNMIIIKNFFQNLPVELEEAAEIDGANDWRIFTTVCLPLSKPVLASISLFCAVGFWNDYFGPMIYLSTNTKFTVQLILRQIITMSQGVQTDGSVIDWGDAGAPPEKSIRMASTVVATVPILIIYPFLQKYFAQGVMVGSVKG